MKWEKRDVAIHKEKDKNNPYEGHSLLTKIYAVGHFLVVHKGNDQK